MNMKFVKSGEKKKILGQLGEQFGISKLPYLLVETGKRKVRGFSGTMTREEIKELIGIANVEIIGAYLIKQESGERLRLSLDGTGIFGKQITKGVVEVSLEESEKWLKGENLECNGEIGREVGKGIYVIKSEGDFLGCGISDGNKIINHVPKERRVRSN
jgi:NOL1/NOP2/fmu family ribosome biogenesis protein